MTSLAKHVLALWEKQWALGMEQLVRTGEDSPEALRHWLTHVSYHGATEGAHIRSGPRPLSFHIHHLLSMWLSLDPFIARLYTSFHDSAETLSSADTPFHQDWLTLKTALRHVPQEELTRELRKLLTQKSTLFIRGFISYHEHPYVRPTREGAPLMWSKDQATLTDYGALSPTSPIIFMVPSLINRSYILDLLPNESLALFLKEQGYRVLLLDWGNPQGDVLDYTLDDYFSHYLLPATDSVRATFPEAPFFALGYCMGGVFTLWLSQLRSLNGLILLAMPWDFHQTSNARIRFYKALPHAIQPLLDLRGHLPGPVIQALFHATNPEGLMEKFERFTQWTSDEKRMLFVALEDWVNDSVPLAKGVAQETLTHWFSENQLAKNCLGFGGKPLDLASNTTPTLLIVGENDRIVPMDKRHPLATLMPCATLKSYPVGHTGLIVGQKAQENIWPTLNSWLQKHEVLVAKKTIKF